MPFHKIEARRGGLYTGRMIDNGMMYGIIGVGILLGIGQMTVWMVSPYATLQDTFHEPSEEFVPQPKKGVRDPYVLP